MPSGPAAEPVAGSSGTPAPGTKQRARIRPSCAAKRKVPRTSHSRSSASRMRGSGADAESAATSADRDDQETVSGRDGLHRKRPAERPLREREPGLEPREERRVGDRLVPRGRSPAPSGRARRRPASRSSSSSSGPKPTSIVIVGGACGRASRGGPSRTPSRPSGGRRTGSPSSGRRSAAGRRGAGRRAGGRTSTPSS